MESVTRTRLRQHEQIATKKRSERSAGSHADLSREPSELMTTAATAAKNISTRSD